MKKLLLKSLIFVPVLAFMVYVNYSVDPAGLFLGDVATREPAHLILEGSVVANYEKFDTRKLNEAIIAGMDKKDVLAFGSSRILTLTHDMVGSDNFFNLGVVAADYRDLFGTFYRLIESDKLPKTLILAVDPWFLTQEFEDRRADTEAFNGFEELLGGKTASTQKAPLLDSRYFALLSPSYFQASVKYYQNKKSGAFVENATEVIDYDKRFECDTIVKMPDGSIIYNTAFRQQSIAELDFSIATHANTPSVIAGGEYDASVKLEGYFKAMLEYAAEHDVEVVIFLPPYHQDVWARIASDPDEYHSIFEVEKFLRDVAAEYNLRIYGSYNPQGFELDRYDFYDGVHLKPQAMDKLFTQYRLQNLVDE